MGSRWRAKRVVQIQRLNEDGVFATKYKLGIYYPISSAPGGDDGYVDNRIVVRHEHQDGSRNYDYNTRVSTTATTTAGKMLRELLLEVDVEMPRGGGE